MKKEKKFLIARDIVLWLVIWGFVFGFFFLGMRQNGVGFVTAPIAVSFYFIIISALVLGVFRGHLHPYVRKFTIIPFIFLLIVFILSTIIYYVIPLYFTSPPPEIVNNPVLNFTELAFPFLVSKGFEILFQQIMIIVLISLLYELKIKFKQMMILIPVIFVLGHIGFFFIGYTLEGLFYAFWALVGIPIFIYLIEKVNYGFVYSYMIHYFFYVLAGAVSWVIL